MREIIQEKDYIELLVIACTAWYRSERFFWEALRYLHYLPEKYFCNSRKKWIGIATCAKPMGGGKIAHHAFIGHRTKMIPFLTNALSTSLSFGTICTSQGTFHHAAYLKDPKCNFGLPVARKTRNFVSHQLWWGPITKQLTKVFYLWRVVSLRPPKEVRHLLGQILVMCLLREL